MFKRVLLIQERGVDDPVSRGLATWLAHRVAELDLVIRSEPPSPVWASEMLWDRVEARAREADKALARFRESLASVPCVVRARTLVDADGHVLDEVFKAGTFDLIVFGVFADERAERIAEWMAHALRVARVPVAWAGRPSRERDHAVTRLLCPVVGDPEGFAPIAAILRVHGEAGLRASVAPMERGESAARWVQRWGSEVSGQPVPLDEAVLEDGWFDRGDALAWFAKNSESDLVLLPFALGPGHAPALRIDRWIERSEVPLLLVPHDAAPVVAPATPLDASDAVCLGASMRVRLELPTYFGRSQPLAEADVAFVWHGRVVTTRTARDGLASIERSAMSSPLAVGVCRCDPASIREHPEPASLVERELNVLGPGAAPVTVVDARTDPEQLRGLAHVVLVRCGTALSFSDTRAKMAAAHVDVAGVIDDDLVLATGQVDDIPSDADAVRLVRVALHLRDAGIAVASVRTRENRTLRSLGIPVETLAAPEAPASLTAPEAPASLTAPEAPAPLTAPSAPAQLAESPRAPLETARPADDDPGHAIERLTGAVLRDGHRMTLLLDNAEARESLLAAIDAARESVHFQSYIVNDDDVARSVLAALTRAVARGVSVRVLVDALYTGHHAFGMEHAGLRALGATPGAEVRATRPIEHAPSLEDLKRRDHRKLVVIDRARALVSGRNTGNEYYRSWHEVPLNATTSWREVPWLDAGTWIEGPIVEDLVATFSEAWCAAGGDPVESRAVPPAGDVSVRLVVHHGLEDAFTLETYRVLIDTARHDLTIVNSFPLTFELLNALVRARERGVRVRLLFGSPRPYHDGGSFPGGSWRDLANELVRGRVVRLIASGAEAYEFAVGATPGWDPTLGRVRPAVHSKLLVADGKIAVMGSANLDVTAAYWESELLLVIHDEGIARALLAAFDGWCAAAFRVDPSAPEWSTRIERREWLSRIWPTWIG